MSICINDCRYNKSPTPQSLLNVKLNRKKLSCYEDEQFGHLVSFTMKNLVHSCELMHQATHIAEVGPAHCTPKS